MRFTTPLIKPTLPFLLILLAPFYLSAQKKIGRYNNQITIGIGSSHFRGDVGGPGGINSTSFPGTDLIDSRPAFLLSFEHRLSNYFSIRTDANYFILKAEDSHSDNIYKKSRNLSFRSRNLSLSALAEVHLFGQNKIEEYKQRGKIDFYLLAGVGGMYFNPKAQSENGKWVALQPLGTEGQGLPGEKEKYKRVAMVIPMGVGITKKLNFGWSLNLEASYHQVMSDYVDDVSTNYHSTEQLRNEDRLAAFFGSGTAVYSNDMGGEVASSKGKQRGNPRDKDSYFFCMLSISKRLNFAGH